MAARTSHADTVVPGCYKDDVESQWKSLKFDARHPKTPEPMATKIGRGDYVPDIYPCAKLHFDPIRGFCPHICEVAYQMFTWLFGGGGWRFPTRYRLGRCADFDDHMSKDVVSRKDVPFGAREQIFYILTPFSSKTQNFGRLSTGLGKFRLKTAFNTGGFVSKHPLSDKLRLCKLDDE